IKWADNADEEIKALDNFNPKQTAVINKKFQSLARIPQTVDENATITLDKNNSDITHLTYKFTSASDQLAVFSEIYYGDSWHAFIDGKQVPHFCVDYILRGLYIPKGSHTVEFKCYSDTLKKGKTVSVIGSVAALVFILGVAAVPFIKKRKTKQEN
ncbi:MAG: hypothetical protein IJ250_00705, partial [Bacteroidales bacterium]|nr:hypothetical protein [Bacteroidales bacterium]